MNNLEQVLNESNPLIGILRGIETKDVIAVSKVLIEEGITIIEVPLNSPNALGSIRLLVKEFGDQYLVGAGTVTKRSEVEDVIATGAKLIVTPNYNQDVVTLAVENNCLVFPGVVTPTEAFNAIADGASGIKIFPVTVLGLAGFKALKSVLPSSVKIFPVGGIDATEESMGPYLSNGAYGFGIGGSLFTPDLSVEEIRERARGFVNAYKKSKK
ncbi:MAG: 2-dehydro-3-deoxy-6-phosphogalactonate aldolase [Marinomonas sp.]|uniref:2-dehydro-3-deoxy-6-phosphogalactonate aldolase n=1 Tax=Marinomonas sp. TaxID=1904862 RepID=UPI003F94CF05